MTEEEQIVVPEKETEEKLNNLRDDAHATRRRLYDQICSDVAGRIRVDTSTFPPSSKYWQTERGNLRKSIKELAPEIRNQTLTLLAELDSQREIGVLDHYASLGLDFFPESTADTHPVVETIIDEDAERSYSLRCKNVYDKQDAHPATRDEQVVTYLQTGRADITEMVKIHETAHSANAWGFDFTQTSRTVFTELVQDIRDRFTAPTHQDSAKIRELHSILAHIALTGSDRKRKVTSIKDLARHAMAHDHVARTKDHNVSKEDLTEINTTHLINADSDLPQWYDNEYQKTKLVAKYVFRTLDVEGTIGATGTNLGRQKNHNKLLELREGRYPEWEKRIISRAKEKGIVEKDATVEEALNIIDKKVDSVIRDLDAGISNIHIATTAAIASTLAVNGLLSEEAEGIAKEAELIAIKAKQTQ